MKRVPQDVTKKDTLAVNPILENLARETGADYIHLFLSEVDHPEKLFMLGKVPFREIPVGEKNLCRWSTPTMRVFASREIIYATVDYVKFGAVRLKAKTIGLVALGYCVTPSERHSWKVDDILHKWNKNSRLHQFLSGYETGVEDD